LCGYVVMVAKLGLEPSGRKSVWVQIPLSAPKKEKKMKRKKQEKQKLENLNILVRNEAESKFVLNIAWRYGYEWRRGNNSKVYKKPSGRIYNKDKSEDGSFIYCFDYESELEEFKLSYFSLKEKSFDYGSMEELIKDFELEVYHASELMEMSSAALDLFLRLR